jgi:ribosome-associated protein
MKKIHITPPFIKLEQALKLASLVSSGGEAKILIRDSRVTVNGEICTARGKKLFGGEKIKLDGCSSREFEVCLNDN